MSNFTHSVLGVFLGEEHLGIDLNNSFRFLDGFVEIELFFIHRI